MSFNTQFLSNPLHFMRTQAMLPPDGSPTGRVLKRWVVSADNFKDGVLSHVIDGRKVVDFEFREGDLRVQFATITPKATFPNALTLKLETARRSGDEIPIHWLPWGKEKVVTTQIPAVPRNLVEPDEDQNPRFFFTAGISGCSVFVKGPATSPTIFHSGTQGTLLRDAGEFWLEQLETATGGKVFESSIFSDVDKSQYMDRNSQAVQAYVKWAQGEGSGGNTFTVELVNNFGCLFGIRYGHHWSFYLQEAGLVSTARFLKQSETVVNKTGPKVKITEKATGLPVQEKMVTVPRHLGPIPLPAKKARIYSTVTQKCVPFRVSEVFPNREWAGHITELMVRHTP
jgi:hypothetical protein